VLAVTLTFPSVEARDAWVEAFKPLAAHVNARERGHGCLAYELLIADDDGRKVMVYER
jgi:quinol monooxygenase YgiN